HRAFAHVGAEARAIELNAGGIDEPVGAVAAASDSEIGIGLWIACIETQRGPSVVEVAAAHLQREPELCGIGRRDVMRAIEAMPGRENDAFAADRLKVVIAE